MQPVTLHRTFSFGTFCSTDFLGYGRYQRPPKIWQRYKNVFFDLTIWEGLWIIFTRSSKWYFSKLKRSQIKSLGTRNKYGSWNVHFWGVFVVNSGVNRSLPLIKSDKFGEIPQYPPKVSKILSFDVFAMISQNFSTFRTGYCRFPVESTTKKPRKRTFHEQYVFLVPNNFI